MIVQAVEAGLTIPGRPPIAGRPNLPEPAASQVKVTIIEDLRDLYDLRPAWDTLHAAMGGTNPFTQWAWMWRWWGLYGRTHGSTRDRLHVIVIWSGGTAWAIVPLVLTTRGYGRLAVRKLRMYGAVPRTNLTEVPAVLVWPGWEAAAADALVATLRDCQAEYAWCDLDNLPMDDALGRWFAARAEAEGWIWRAPVSGHVLTLPATWEALRAGLKRNIKESLRRCYNSLARDGHQWRFEAVTQLDQLPGALNQFFELHTARAAMQQGPSHPDHFARSWLHRAFLQLVGADLAPEGRFMVCRLWVNDAVVASTVVLPTGDNMYMYYSGFDPAWGRYSVMTTLTAECIKLAIASGARTVDFSPGTAVSKTRWGTRERAYGQLRIVAPTVAARALNRGQQWVSSGSPALSGLRDDLARKLALRAEPG